MDTKNDLTGYVDKLYSAALKKAGDPHVAEDLVQETFLAAVQALANGKEPAHLWNWLYTILSNKYYDWLRDKYNKPQISFDSFMLDIPDENELDDDSFAKMEAIRRELGYLTKIHREVMVRFYMHGDTIEKIADCLHIPIGTVKSRLNAGRKHVKERVVDMENYTKQSYDPDTLRIACAGSTGLNEEPFSLVEHTDKLTQNILILAYPKPISETELAKLLGVPAAFVEPVVEKLVNGELMKRTEGGRVYTDFIIYTDSDRKATFKKQLAVVDQHFNLFWDEMEKALAELEKQDYYVRQTPHGKAKLKLHFCIKLLLFAHVSVRDEVTGAMPFSEYPYRKDGGRWIAMGQHFSSGHDYENDAEFWKYSISGETGIELKNFRDTKSLQLRTFNTELGSFPNNCLKPDYVQWLYELYRHIPYEESSAGEHILESVDSLIQSGILQKEHTLTLDIPVLTKEEYNAESKLVSGYVQDLSQTIREILLPVFETGYVKLPSHLTNIPKWQQYMYCGCSVPLAVIYKAMEKGLFLTDMTGKIPASILVVENM
ncbi:MAG TPA: RNA polymerase sigma factor [Firmicutes bacterium]|nr:RNA polymerase sigma factor [Bacillota bacterium]